MSMKSPSRARPIESHQGRALPAAGDGVRRAAGVLRGLVALLANTARNTQRLVDDAILDSATVGRNLSALGAAGTIRAGELKRALSATPRVSRIIREIARVVASYRMLQLRCGLAGVRPDAETRDALHRLNAQRLYDLCIELRGGLVKLGQFASARMDLLPQPYVEQLSLLQDRVPPVPTERIVARVERELGRPLGALFREFEEDPIATASLAQVHGATLHDGSQVVVKVQLPGIGETVAADLVALRMVAKGLSDHLPALDLSTTADELARAVAAELDFVQEAESARAFADRFAARAGVVIPAVHAEYSAGRVIVLERLNGQRLLDFLDDCEARGQAGAEDRDALLEHLIHFYCEQILVHGCFHADPHPGNFLVLPGPRLAVLDFGCVMTYSPPKRAAYGRLAGTVLRGDAAAMAELLETMGFEARGGDRSALERFAASFLALFRVDLSTDFSRLDPRDQLGKALRIAKENPVVRIPSDFVLLGRVFATLGGVMLRYRANVNLATVVLPYLQQFAH